MPGTLFAGDKTIPPVGSYNPRHEAIEKSKNNTVISATEEPRLWPDPVNESTHNSRKTTSMRARLTDSPPKHA